jgi:cytoskeleton protein RodZ
MASFGDNLKRERELRGVELREMADATKISIRFLQALEQDRVDVLPGGIFPRAFVKQYAKYLGLDADRMVAEFDFAFGHDPAPARKPAPEVYDGGLPRGVLVIVVVVLGLALLAWRVAFHRGGPEEATQASPAPALPPQALPRPEDRVYPPPTVPTTAPASGQLVLALTAQQSCWTEVKADGVVVLSRVLSQGETQRFEAKNEFALSVGNAGGVTFSVNDRPGIALGKEGDVRRNVIISRQSLPSLLAEPQTAAAPTGGR